MGKGAPRIGRPPPFIGNWKGSGARRVKKKTSNWSRTNSRQTLSVQQNSYHRRYSIKKPKFHKDIPMSNFDLLEWCKYLKIPINNVLSRDMKVPHNHKQALFIYHLEPL